jgi:hypothetical protein
MATAASFDTLAYAKKLRDAGVPEAQAEVHAEALAAVIEGNLATKTDAGEIKRDVESLRAELKRDIESLRAELTRDIESLRAELTRDIESLRTELTRDIAEMGYKLTIRMGGMAVIIIGVLATLMKAL